MKKHQQMIMDGNEAAAWVAHRVNEVIAIYPITPASPMGEFSDAWSAAGQRNIWGTVPQVIEMQSEGGAAGVVHGALQSGALTTTFTASQGLLLMLPNLFRIAGELTPAVIHVAARSIATHALSIFGDHSDVMVARTTGMAMLASNSVQEAMDFALIAHAATLKTRIPFIHFFDGFRTSHEIQKIDILNEDILRAMINDELVRAHRARALTPDNPFIRGTAQNPDVFFQAREAANKYYDVCPARVQEAMDQFAALTGRSYNLVDYVGHPKAERVMVMMGSGAETAEETVQRLAAAGEKVGLLKIRLFRPFPIREFLMQLPASIKMLAVLDRTKEPGSIGEPLYQDVQTALAESEGLMPIHFSGHPHVIGGRYGLSSKEFTPGMVEAVLAETAKVDPRNRFTVGINDDVTNLSLDYSEPEPEPVAGDAQCMFYGLGSDGTVSANKNSIKILGKNSAYQVQGYFVYDSKKAGSVTVSHLRFSKKAIHSTYLVQRANFIGCHQWNFLSKFDVLEKAAPGATLLLNSPYDAEHLWTRLPARVQKDIIEKKLTVYAIDAYRIAADTGLGRRINTIMQACFFKIAGILPEAKAVKLIKDAIQATYGKKGEWLTQKNFEAVDAALKAVFELDCSGKQTGKLAMPPVMSSEAPEFVRDVLGEMIRGNGDALPVSALPADGTFPSATTQWEKRNIAQQIPVWDEEICIQCGKCAMVCPHAVIRIKAYDPAELKKAPQNFKSTTARGREWPEKTAYTIQVAPEDCTGCELCVEVCPARSKSQSNIKALNMMPHDALVEKERPNWEFFLKLPETDPQYFKPGTVKGSQFLRPLFEFSGACAGCGETPYIKLATQLFGDRMIVANATGCSSIYGGNLPTTPWAKNSCGQGPAWSNSLFEDNAEFGLGFRVAINKHQEQARELVAKMLPVIGKKLAGRLLENSQHDEAAIYEQREDVARLKKKLAKETGPEARSLVSLADYLVRKSVWIIGGDGWAYDIGYGGLDHVMASGYNVNILVLDTEVYSNTGGQMSKATPLGASAKFAAAGKRSPKKDLAMHAMSYGNVYVARVAMGANDTHTVKAFMEAERFNGPSIIIAYTPCIAHGYNMRQSLTQQKLAVQSGYWPLFRFNPAERDTTGKPFILDSRGPAIPLSDYIYNEARYTVLKKSDPKLAAELLKEAQQHVNARWKLYEQMGSYYESRNGVQNGESDEEKREP